MNMVLKYTKKVRPKTKVLFKKYLRLIIDVYIYIIEVTHNSNIVVKLCKVNELFPRLSNRLLYKPLIDSVTSQLICCYWKQQAHFI